MHLARTFLAVAVVTVCAGTAASAQGKLEIIGGDTYDWGTVAPGKLTTTVEVKNTGNDELKITEVRPGCGCTAAPIDKNLLKPAEIGKINITLDVSTRTGPVEKTVSITSSDSSQPVRILHLKANIKRAITFTPSQYFVVTEGKMGTESPATSIRISNTSDAPLTIYPPEFGQGNVKVRFDLKDKKELKPGEEYELKAFVTPLESETLYGSAKMKTSSTESPMVDLTISGTMSRPAVVSPAQSQGPGTSNGSAHSPK
jgi:archaellum component FlaG (FlaF/FlaG flagellin family)